MPHLMERALQERVIGAIVLVVAAVLIVPIFLDGPSPEAELVSEAVTLPGQNDQERKTQTIVLERNRSEPVPASTAAAGPEADPEPEPEEPQPAPRHSETPPQAVAAPTAASTNPQSSDQQQSTTGMWAVQLGSFSNQQNAERLAADLREQGFAAFLSQVGAGSDQLHRVRIGPQKDRDSAESVASELGKAGHKGQVVPHP